jgi:hypothetical protein
MALLILISACKLRGYLIGEATLAILNDSIRISWPGILNKLNSFHRQEKDENRVHALNLAIRDVSGEIKRRGAGQKNGRENRTENLSDEYDDQTWH